MSQFFVVKITPKRYVIADQADSSQIRKLTNGGEVKIPELRTITHSMEWSEVNDLYVALVDSGVTTIPGKFAKHFLRKNDWFFDDE